MKIGTELSNVPQEPEELKPDIVLFFGAGASVEAGVPTTFDFVKEFKESLEENQKEIVNQIEDELKQWLQKKTKNTSVDVELLMETFDKLIRRDDEPLLVFYEARKAELEKILRKEKLLDKLKNYVKKRAKVPKEKCRYLDPFRGFIQEYKNLDIFSVNYDICIEQFCNLHKKSYRDGFEVEWNPKVFEDPDIDIRLYKLHGSITWYRTRGGGFVKSMIESENEDVRLITGEKAEALMLYPMRKWEYAEPLLENLLKLKNKLQSPDCQYVIVVGYSFRDDYIRDIFWDSANKNKQLTLVLIDPNAFKIYQDKLEYFDRKEQIPSSLKDRVVFLPFRFEKVFPFLQYTYFKNLKQGMNSFMRATQDELLGAPYVDWASCMKLLADGGHTDKVDEILRTKLMPVPKYEYNEMLILADRTVHIDLLASTFENLKSLHEVFFKQCIHLYSCQRMTEAKDALLDIAALLYIILYSKLSIEVRGNWVDLKPNTPLQPNKRHDDVRYLHELYLSFQHSCEQLYFENEKIKTIRKLVTNITSYLREWGYGELDISKYVQLRSTGRIQAINQKNVEEVSSLYASYEKSESNKEQIAKSIEDAILKIERGIVRNILSKFVRIA